MYNGSYFASVLLCKSVPMLVFVKKDTSKNVCLHTSILPCGLLRKLFPFKICLRNDYEREAYFQAERRFAGTRSVTLYKLRSGYGFCAPPRIVAERTVYTSLQDERPERRMEIGFSHYSHFEECSFLETFWFSKKTSIAVSQKEQPYLSGRFPLYKQKKRRVSLRVPSLLYVLAIFVHRLYRSRIGWLLQQRRHFLLQERNRRLQMMNGIFPAEALIFVEIKL